MYWFVEISWKHDFSTTHFVLLVLTFNGSSIVRILDIFEGEDKEKKKPDRSLTMKETLLWEG
jgi:hypothetical protein